MPPCRTRKKVWRLDPKKAGVSSCIGDIGTHAFQMTEYLTGMEVKSILSDLNMLYDNNTLDLDGTVLIRFSDTVKGVIRASQIATGKKMDLLLLFMVKKEPSSGNKKILMCSTISLMISLKE